MVSVRQLESTSAQLCPWCKDIAVIFFAHTDLTEEAALRKHPSAALDSPSHNFSKGGGELDNLQLLATLPGCKAHMLYACSNFHTSASVLH